MRRTSDRAHDDTADVAKPPGSADACGSCAVAAASRRAFLRDVAVAVVGALALSAADSRAAALAQSVSEISPRVTTGAQRKYALPTANSVSVDVDNDVILARWQNRVYAFSRRCPHKGAALEWVPSEGRVFCPKHKARFQPDGAHASGRESRDLDRFDIALEGGSVVVDLNALRRADQDPQAWAAAFIAVA